jgi:hypothetical protein
MRKIAIALLIMALVIGAYVYYLTGTPTLGRNFAVKNTPVSSIDLVWLNTNRTITASNDCAHVIKTLCEARESPSPASPPLGTLTIHYADSTTDLIHLHPNAFFTLEISDDTGGYAISMRKLLDTFKSTGLLTKDE